MPESRAGAHDVLEGGNVPVLLHFDGFDDDGWGQKNERRTGTFCGGAEDVTPMPDDLADGLRGEVLPLGTIIYYGARYGIPLSIKAADYIANRWKPGTVNALLVIFTKYYGCRNCQGSW